MIGIIAIVAFGAVWRLCEVYDLSLRVCIVLSLVAFFGVTESCYWMSRAVVYLRARAIDAATKQPDLRSKRNER